MKDLFTKPCPHIAWDSQHGHQGTPEYCENCGGSGRIPMTAEEKMVVLAGMKEDCPGIPNHRYLDGMRESDNYHEDGAVCPLCIEGQVYRFPSSVRVTCSCKGTRLQCSCGTPLPYGSFPCSGNEGVMHRACQGRGWNPSMDFEVWLEAVQLYLSDGRVEAQVWRKISRGEIGSGRSDNAQSAFIDAICKAVENEGILSGTP